LALAVPLSRFTPRVGGGSAFFVRPRDTFRFELAGLAGDDLSSLILMSEISAVSLGLARARSRHEQVRRVGICERH
jgi:hypothetical protein